VIMGASHRPLARARRRLAATLVAVAVVGTALAGAPPVARADASSDIPGILLPGPIVTGVLGGPVYDVVYRLTAPAGSVILADLTGSPGTDFDLYIFDASATTVITNVGVVARSTGPTSDEHVAFATAAGGTFYIDLNGATEAEGTFSLAVQTVVDRTAPIMTTITINGGMIATNSLAATVAVTAFDDISGVVGTAFSFDGTSYGAWQPYGAPAAIALPPGDGPKIVWAKVRSGVGLESAPLSARIVVDTVAPTILGVSPDGGAHVASLRPTIRVRFDEPVDPGLWARSGVVVQRADGTRVAGSATLDSAGTTGSFTPTSDLAPGAAVSVTVGPVSDLAGNPLAGTVPSWLVVPLRPASLTAKPTLSIVTWRGGTAIVGRYVGAAPVPAIRVASRAAGATEFGIPVPVTVAADGSFQIPVRPSETTVWRVTAAETGVYAAVSVPVRVSVRRSISLGGSGPTVVRSARRGRSVAVVATLGPAAPATAVTLTAFRYNVVTRAWRVVATITRTTSSAGSTAGRVTFSWTPPTQGSYRVHLTTRSSGRFVAGSSGTYRYLVY